MVIGPEGQNLGRMSSREANALAATYNLDLFCVAPNANPPVCKILNYGKYRFEQQKKDRELKKHSKQAELNEVQLHISMSTTSRPRPRKPKSSSKTETKSTSASSSKAAKWPTKISGKRC